MEETAGKVVIDTPFFRIFTDLLIDRLVGEETVPSSANANTGVRYKDVVVLSNTGLPPEYSSLKHPTRPVNTLSSFSSTAAGFASTPRYHDHVAALAAGANAVALSVHYRRATEHLLPTAFDDALEALRWAGAHREENVPEAWLNDYANFDRVFVVGASAGATIAHYTVRQAGVDGLRGLGIVGLATVHPFFNNDEPDKLIEIIFPTRIKSGDPRLDPEKDPELGMLGCGKVLVFAAEKDFLRERGSSRSR
ncbi:putative carboxylesterase 2 [Morus notabilis]|uniref:Putative carboxylesterase 2 n=1 Tax=Morus notabilis TaxID=981085 RepID=W9S6B6_9ROSA|nr:probable carboxylesterase 2 [Morus notabilis]EXC17365.1 putative carboxylesterase 2 [Morus notabilis]